MDAFGNSLETEDVPEVSSYEDYEHLKVNYFLILFTIITFLLIIESNIKSKLNDFSHK